MERKKKMERIKTKKFDPLDPFFHFKIFAIKKALRIYSKPIELASGKKSLYYIDWRPVVTNKDDLEKLLGWLIIFIEKKKIDATTFIGIPDTMSHVGIMLQKEIYEKKMRESKEKRKKQQGEYKDYVILRKIPKEHGLIEEKYWIGKSSKKVALLEDVVTTGSTLINYAKLIKEKVSTLYLIALTDRSSKEVKRKLDTYGKYFYLTTLEEMLEIQKELNNKKNK